MKKIIAVAIAFVVCAAFARTVSLDLRSTAQNTSRSRLLGASSSSEGTLRSFNLDAGAAEVGYVATGDELIFTLFDDVEITLTLGEQMPSPLGGDVFLAEASGYDGVKNAVVLRTSDGLTIDVQDYINDRVYKVISTPNGVMVQEIQPSHDVKCGCDALEPPELKSESGMPSLDSLAIPGEQIDELTNTYRPWPEQEAAGGETSAAAYSDASTPMSYSSHKLLSSSSEEPSTYVDILVAYDKGASKWVEDNGGITNFAIIAVSRMNTALANTELDNLFRFRLVGITCVEASTDVLDTALTSATYGYDGWAPINAKRDDVGADIVSVLIDTGSESGTVGLGWSLNTTSFASFSESAYNACAIRSVAQTSTMAHECGHNMGCGHSDVQKTQPGPQLYDYSSGYYFVANGTAYSTIMAYGHENPSGATTTDAPYFSSPDYSLDDVAVGDEKHDNTRTIRQTYAAVAAFRESTADEIIHDGGASHDKLNWLTEKEEAFSKALSEGKKVFLIYGHDGCGNTVGTKDYSCENELVKPYLKENYVCWYGFNGDSYAYFINKRVGETLPFVAIIDPVEEEALEVAGGYQGVTALRLMLGRVAKEITFTPPDGTMFSDSLSVTLSSADENAEIRYTLNGAMPTENSLLYKSAINITQTTTIRALTVKDGVVGLPCEAIYGNAVEMEYGGYKWDAHICPGGCSIQHIVPTPVGDVEIPTAINGYTVVALDADLFYANAAITSVSIPSGVETLAMSAFQDCTALTNVVIGAGVMSIGVDAFAGCTALECIYIPPSLSYVGDRAFLNCNALKAIHISDIAAWCKITFSGMAQTNPLYYGHNLYLDGELLTNLVIPESVTGIPQQLFYNCSCLESVVVHGGVKIIGSWAFLGCTRLERFVLGEGVQSIGNYAFNGCTNLLEISIPKNTSSIGEGAFINCDSLSAIHVDAANRKYADIDGILF